MDIGSASSLITSFNSLIELTKGGVDARDQALVETKIAEINRTVLEAQQFAFSMYSEHMDLRNSHNKLSDELIKIKNWDDEKEKYQLITVGTGAYTYALKKGMEENTPPHWICPTCFENQKKSILQLFESAYGSWEWTCKSPECKTIIRTEENIVPEFTEI